MIERVFLVVASNEKRSEWNVRSLRRGEVLVKKSHTDVVVVVVFTSEEDEDDGK